MAPLQLDDEVFVLALRAQTAHRFAGAVNFPVAHAPRLGGAVDVRPTGQITAVEHRHEAIGIGPGCFRGPQKRPKSDQGQDYEGASKRGVHAATKERCPRRGKTNELGLCPNVGALAQRPCNPAISNRRPPLRQFPAGSVNVHARFPACTDATTIRPFSVWSRPSSAA